MLLKQLYRHSKFYFTITVLFFVAFIYINMKWGAVATPVYTYGMFSGKHFLKDTIVVYKIYDGDMPVSLDHLHFAERDNLEVLLQKYDGHLQKNLAVLETMQKIPAIGKMMTEKNYTSNASPEAVSNWFKSKFASLAGFSVYKHKYVWNAGLQQVSSPEKMIFAHR